VFASAADGLWQRYPARILDGLRAVDRPPLPGPPPPVDAVAVILRTGKPRLTRDRATN